MMTYLSAALPAPQPDIDDAPLWAAYREKRMVFQKCGECGKFRHPPMPTCPQCLSDTVEWAEPVGPAILFTYTITHVAPHPQMTGHTPYNIAIVDFPESDHVRLITNIVDSEPTPDDIGGPVSPVWEPVTEGSWVPRFRMIASVELESKS